VNAFEHAGGVGHADSMAAAPVLVYIVMA
jgi:hypothetical protein